MKPIIDLNKEYGLVFDGGGARGAYQIGAWRALSEAGVKIRISSDSLVFIEKYIFIPFQKFTFVI